MQHCQSANCIPVYCSCTDTIITHTDRTLTVMKMFLSLLLLTSLTLTCLPLSQSYRGGARSESCYNMAVMHANFLQQIVSPIECGSPCQFQLRMVGRVVGENNLTVEEEDSTTYQCGEVYQCKWGGELGQLPHSFFSFLEPLANMQHTHIYAYSTISFYYNCHIWGLHGWGQGEHFFIWRGEHHLGDMGHLLQQSLSCSWVQPQQFFLRGTLWSKSLGTHDL